MRICAAAAATHLVVELSERAPSLDAAQQRRYADAVTDRMALTQGNTALAVELYRREAAEAKKENNLFLSPYSISVAMALVDAGARGDTAGAFEQAMRFPFGGERLAAAWEAVIRDVNEGAGAATLITANALWAAKQRALRPEYLELTRRRFGASVENVDFAHAPNAAAGRINSWVEEATRGMITDLIAEGMLDPDTILVLTNVIYMKAIWRSPFDAALTDEEGVFFGSGGKTRAPLMTQQDGFRIFHGDGLRVLELPYEGELTMLIVLPDARDGLAAVEQALTPEALTRWDAGLQWRTIHLRLPRFSIESRFMLRSTLEELGVPFACADLSGIVEGGIVVSEVVHKARVDVTEEGTEAAAATAGWRLEGVMPFAVQVEDFTVDHPFLFLIRRNWSNSLLFIGRVTRTGEPRPRVTKRASHARGSSGRRRR